MSNDPAFLDSTEYQEEYQEASTEEKTGYCDVWLQNHPDCREVKREQRFLVQLQQSEGGEYKPNENDASSRNED
jgi:hypothetical protein